MYDAVLVCNGKVTHCHKRKKIKLLTLRLHLDHISTLMLYHTPHGRKFPSDSTDNDPSPEAEKPPCKLKLQTRW